MDPYSSEKKYSSRKPSDIAKSRNSVESEKKAYDFSPSAGNPVSQHPTDPEIDNGKVNCPEIT